jgi:hypothetical protein
MPGGVFDFILMKSPCQNGKSAWAIIVLMNPIMIFIMGKYWELSQPFLCLNFKIAKKRHFAKEVTDEKY